MLTFKLKYNDDDNKTIDNIKSETFSRKRMMKKERKNKQKSNFRPKMAKTHTIKERRENDYYFTVDIVFEA